MKTVSKNIKDWPEKLIDALWAYHTAFKKHLGMPPYTVIYRQPCHLPIELESRTWWAIRTLNFDLNVVSEKRRLSLNELGEIRRETYDNTRLSKDRANICHDRQMNRKVVFSTIQKVVL